MKKLSKVELKKSEAMFSEYESRSTGTENYYTVQTFSKRKMPLVITDGVKEMREKLKCFWLIEMVESHMGTINEHYEKIQENFFVARVIKDTDKQGGALFVVDDGNYNILLSQRVPYSDLKVNVRMYLINDSRRWVLMCPEEY